MNRKAISAVAVAIAGIAFLSSCTKEADDVNKNLAVDADNFKVARTVTFVNGITDKEMLQITGYCSVDMSDPQRYGVTCKTDGGKYVKHLLGKSDNVTVVVEQNEPTDTSASHYRFVLRPGALIPAVESEPTK